MSWMNTKMQEGKVKIGICDYSKCETKEMDTLYRVKENTFICGKCLDVIEDKLNLLGVWNRG